MEFPQPGPGDVVVAFWLDIKCKPKYKDIIKLSFFSDNAVGLISVGHVTWVM